MKKIYCQNWENITCGYLMGKECNLKNTCIFKVPKPPVRKGPQRKDDNTYAIIGFSDKTTIKIKLTDIIGTNQNKEIQIANVNSIKFINIWRYN